MPIPAIVGVFAGISAAASVASGIAGAAQASSQNAQAQSNYEAQRRAAEDAARRTNEYNRRVFAADQENYRRQRQYEWDTTLLQHQYNQTIQDRAYRDQSRQYLSSVENTATQLTYNSVAAQRASEQEQASLAEILSSDAFQREGLIIEQIQNEGRAALLQAGGSRVRAIQSTVAEQGRNAAILSASLVSAGQQSLRNQEEIALQRYSDDLQARNAMMIRPERLPDIPRPIQPPERVFVEPMEATAAYIPTPMRQSIFAPLTQSIASATGTLTRAGVGRAFG